MVPDVREAWGWSMGKLRVVIVTLVLFGCASLNQSGWTDSRLSDHAIQVHAIFPRYAISSHSAQRAAPNEAGREWSFEELVEESTHLARTCLENWCWEFNFSPNSAPPRLPVTPAITVHLVRSLASYLTAGDVVPIHASIYLLPPSDTIDDIRLMTDDIPSVAFAFHYPSDDGGPGDFETYRATIFAGFISVLMHEIQHVQFILDRHTHENIKSLESLRRNEAVSVCWERAARAAFLPRSGESLRVASRSQADIDVLEQVFGKSNRMNASLLVPAVVEARLSSYLHSLEPAGRSRRDIVIRPTDAALAKEVIRFCRALTMRHGDMWAVDFSNDFVRSMPAYEVDGIRPHP